VDHPLVVDRLVEAQMVKKVVWLKMIRLFVGLDLPALFGAADPLLPVHYGTLLRMSAAIPQLPSQVACTPLRVPVRHRDAQRTLVGAAVSIVALVNRVRCEDPLMMALVFLSPTILVV
jgi:hypothetical protein